MSAPAHQLRLLLWKDYLVRKRKWITLGGILWATLVTSSLYIVRVNIDNVDYPTCQFPARALPSAGMLTFLQSFICSVNNECSPLDQYEEIPTYENSKLTQLQRKFSPLLYNETVLEVAGTVPDALKLLSKLADVADEPTFVQVSKHGLRVADIFKNLKSVKRYLRSQLGISDDVASSVMAAQLSFQGIFKGIDRCNKDSISQTVMIENKQHLETFVSVLCSLTNKDVQNIASGLLLEIDFSKYIKMIGNMYFKLNGDDRVGALADMVTAALRMTSLQSFISEELAAIMQQETSFTYVRLDLIQKLIDLFKPTFSDTEAFKAIKDFADTAIIGVQYLSKFLAKQTNDTVEEVAGLVGDLAERRDGLKSVGKMFNKAVVVLKATMFNDSSVDVINILSQLTNFIYKWIPDNLKHDVLLYSTLLTKLIAGANKVIDINMNIEETAYDVSLRHPGAIRILVNLPSHIVGKGFEALTDAGRTQIATSKINTPGQMFCDANKIQAFFMVSKTEASSLKTQLCTDAWKNYVTDLISSFGIYAVRDNVNIMASLFIQETLGKDTSDQLYTLDYDFLVLKNFTQSLSSFSSSDNLKPDWIGLFNVTEDSEFIKTIRSKSHLGKQMLITVHGALAKEVVNQNPILSFKISGILIDTTTLVAAINKQLESTDKELVERVKEMYPMIVKTVLRTALDENKTYKSLSAHSEDVLCRGNENASKYLQLPPEVPETLVLALCNVSKAIEAGLKRDSLFGKAIDAIMASKHSAFSEVNWTSLISGLKDMYVKLDGDYPYLFQYSNYGMDSETRDSVDKMFEEAKQLWFGSDLGRSLRLSLKLGFRMLDLLDRPVFNLTDQLWLKVKYSLHSISGPLTILDDVVKLVTALYRNETVPSDLPQKTVAALTQVIPNFPQLLVDASDLLARGDTDVDAMISFLNTAPYWPCSATSISSLLTLSRESARAVRGLETLLCMDQGFQEEWERYLVERRVDEFDLSQWNKTKLHPHVFLRFSSALDSLIDDSSLLADVVKDMSSGNARDGHMSWLEAWNHAIEVFSSTEGDSILGNFFTKLDVVLESLNTTDVPSELPLKVLWTQYLMCPSKADACSAVGRAAWKDSLKFVSVMFLDVATDLLTYFREVNEPDSNLLQMVGFTRDTTLYQMYARLPDYVSVLLNSYWDYGFMSQVRRASLSQFWDCAAVIGALVPAADSPLDVATLRKVEPYVCPSLLYWLSLPRGDNVLLDVVAKPNYLFYTLDVQNLTSSYANAYNKLSELVNSVTELAKTNQTLLKVDDLKLNNLGTKFESVIDTVLNYKINSTDVSYRLFNDINEKQFVATIYLTRIVSITNKLTAAVEELTINDITETVDEEGVNKLKADLTTIQKTFKRKPHEAIAFHFDVLTKLIWENYDNFNYTNAVEAVCLDLKNNDTRKDILVDNQRVKNIVCSKDYKLIFKAIEKEIVDDDYGKARESLMNLIRILQNDENLDNVSDINEFLSQRKKLINYLRTSIKYSYELSIPIYLQYLQSNLQHYDVLLAFLSGADWWKDLRDLYRGPYASEFLQSMEKSFDVADDVLGNLDKIHLVRLLRDIDVNNTDAFCAPAVVLSEYVPDATGVFSRIKAQLCEEEKGGLFRELPPLLFASQGYDSSLKLPRTINYTALDLDISKTESRLTLVRSGPLTPQRPPWVTEERLARLKTALLGLLSKETLARVSFGVVANLVDAGTLFLNNSQCSLCSTLTSWFKQLNLQLFKKQEYDALLCRLPEMQQLDVYRELKNEFHWDMAIRELISTRNYTNFELNKSMNEFLELVKLHSLEDLLATRTKLSQCLAHNVTRNEFGNATLFVTILSQTTRLLKSMVPHLHEIEGIKDLPYLKQLHASIAHNLDVERPLRKYLTRAGQQEIEAVVGADVGKEIADGYVNLRVLLVSKEIENIKLSNNSWESICATHSCAETGEVIYNNLNRDLIEQELPDLQTSEFWRFPFVANILQHLESTLSHVGRVLGVLSHAHVRDLSEGRLAALIDLGVLMLRDESVGAVVYSLQGLADVLHALLQGVPLELDLQALGKGLEVLHQFKNYLLEKVDLTVEVSKVFTTPERVERGLTRLGINNTNFWSVAAPRVHSGRIDLKPILSTKQGDFHIADFVCQLDHMSLVIMPSDLDVVTADDVFGAIAEQFCGLDDERVKEILPVILMGVDFNAVFGKLKDLLLPQLYAASNLTQAEGDAVLARLPRMAALVPVVQENVGELTETFANEPLIKELGESGSLGGLLSSSQFLSHAGAMLCGKPFETSTSRFYKAIAASEDFSNEPDQAQLDVLPTDFCRDLYKDIVNMEGGKIVWSFVKPLIMGKILYTPANPTVERIIQKANSSFAHMTKLTSLIHSFAAALPSVDGLSHHRAGVGALRDVITSGFGEYLGLEVSGDLDFEGVFDDFGDMQGIGKLMQRGSDLLRCINLDRFRPAPDEYQLTHEAVKLSRVNEFSAGLVFLKTEQSGGRPLRVEYKIRMDIENAPTTTRKQNFFWIPGPESSFIEDMRYFRGFVQVQDLVDSAIIQLSRSGSRRKRETADLKWAVYTQQEPYPCYRKDFFQTSLYASQALVVAFFFSLLFTVSSAVRFVVADKESGNTMLLSVMGVSLSNHTLSWFAASLLELAATAACVACVLCVGGVLPRSAPTLVLALLLVFGVAALAFCYMLSKLFSSASSAAVCAGIAYLMTFMPFVLILSLEAVLGTALKLVVCLSMSSAICYSFMLVTQLEAMGVGASWGQLWHAPEGDMSIGLGAVMALVDAGIYFAIGLLLDRYFGPKTIQTSITHCTTSGEKAGVSIVGVTKSYGSGRRRTLALDNVSVELHSGQITTLLGHNGAGKTTLLNILMGMLKPTKGHVIIRSPRADTRVGVCPQRDVLLDYMTPAEHVSLYAQLKSGRRLCDVQEEVDSMLRVLSLGASAHERAARLSGGTRRRLCVALAFVARPHLVSLDEPTSGVDPAARRDIWSLIVKLRADRTILLTTHHLDEAELLSDQIIIMHKGQVHTTGSPIEIKRSLGNGYKLTVTYPDKSDESEPWPEESFSIEERSKQLLSVVRQAVHNASVADVCGLEVEVALPFFDAHGLNSNYLHLCTLLDTQQAELGYRGYSMDCSSLEQVFFNICQQADAPQHEVEYDPDIPSKSASTSSVRSDDTPLVPAEGPLKGSHWEQFTALIHARYLHYIRNRWLLFLLIILPSIFVTTAMGFSMIRPPADNEFSLLLDRDVYGNATQYLVSHPSISSKNIDPTFAERVMDHLRYDKNTKNWTTKDTPTCKCSETRQDCDLSDLHPDLPTMLALPDVSTLNNWLVASHDAYMEKRYGGFTSAIRNNATNLVAWYNNKGHHAMPAYLNALNTAILRTVSGDRAASIRVYSHPLKISKEQISKDTVYQHVADAGIAGLVLIAYSLVSAGGAAWLVAARRSQEKRLQLLCGAPQPLYWAAALAADMAVILINLVITAIVFEAFGFPVFVARSNLPAICILIILYGFACSALVHVAEKLFSEPSLATMVLFCGNAFAGLAGVTLLLILDIIAESDATADARWVLHKLLLLCPQFVLGDGLLEIAKNTIQAQVLERFGMDTYRDPLRTSLLLPHYAALLVVGAALVGLNLAIEYDYIELIVARFRSTDVPNGPEGEMEDLGVSAERTRVRAAVARAAERPLRLPTIGNINAGFVDTEVKNKEKNSMRRVASRASDVAQVVELSKVFPAVGGRRVAVRKLTLGIPPRQCTALLGQNGAGKSTTFSMLTGELRPTAGQIYLGERRANRSALCEGLISYCPQSDALDPLLTVRETLLLYCRLRGITEREEVIKRALDMFSLRRLAHARAGALSGGNRRKLCCCVALTARAPLVLLDEPTSGMDPLSRACVARGVRAACAGARGVLLSTHALDDARRLAARVALVRAGALGALAPLHHCLQRFGGGYVVACRVSRGAARDVWRHVRARAPHASLRVMHHAMLHFLLPIQSTVDKKELTTSLSDVFRLMAELQAACDIEDYTVNQSSLDQMFLSFTEKGAEELEPVELESLPTPPASRRRSGELDSITSL